MLEELRAAQQKIRDAEKTIFCSPKQEAQIKELTAFMKGIFTVIASPAVPEGTVYITDSHYAKGISEDERLADTW